MVSTQNSYQQWFSSWNTKLSKLQGSSWIDEQQLRASTTTIFKVPERIRGTDPSAYEPKVVSVGPYHRNKPHLKSMENVKQLYLERFIHRHPENNPEVYLKLINDLMAKARCCYSEDEGEINNMNENEFRDMLLIDGCFIVELLMAKNRTAWQAEDPILGNMLTLSLVEFDMLLLENQLPFFLIEELYRLVADTEREESLVYLTVSFFDGILQRCKTTPTTTTRFDHFLHLFHSYFVVNPPEAQSMARLREKYNAQRSTGDANPSRRNPGATQYVLMTPSAIELMNTNMKFKRMTKENFGWKIDLEQRVIKIWGPFNFKRGLRRVIKICPARLNSNSNSFYRNLIAYEQYFFPKVWSRVMGYVLFMSCLISSENDLALLRRERIVEYTLDCHEAAHFFRKICKDSMVDYDKAYLPHLDDVSTKVWECYNTVWNRYKAIMKSNPANSIYFIASVIFVIVLTTLQTVYTVLTYYNSNSSCTCQSH